MKKLLIALCVVLMLAPSAQAALDIQKLTDKQLESWLAVAEYFAPMTQEEIRQFILDIKIEMEIRKGAATEMAKGTVIYEDEAMRLILLGHTVIHSGLYGDISAAQMEWLNKTPDAKTWTAVFKVSQYQNGVELKSAYVTGYDEERTSNVRGGAALTFYSLGVIRDQGAGIDLVFDMPYFDYRNQFEDIVIKLR